MDRGIKSIKNRHGCHLYYTQYSRTGQVNTIFSEGKLLEKRLFSAPAVSTALSESIVFRSNRFRVAVRECVYIDKVNTYLYIDTIKTYLNSDFTMVVVNGVK